MRFPWTKRVRRPVTRLQPDGRTELLLVGHLRVTDRRVRVVLADDIAEHVAPGNYVLRIKVPDDRLSWPTRSR